MPANHFSCTAAAPRHAVRMAALSLAAFSAITAGAAGDLSESLRDGSIFRTPVRENAAFQGEAFAWIVEGSQLRFVRPGFTIGAVHPGETIVEIADDGAPRKFRVSVYNRGDDGPLGDTTAAATQAFAAKLRETASAIEAVAGAKGTPYRRKTDPTKTTADIAGCRWTTGAASVTLEWALGRDQRTPQPEYMRVELVRRRMPRRSPRSPRRSTPPSCVASCRSASCAKRTARSCSTFRWWTRGRRATAPPPPWRA